MAKLIPTKRVEFQGKRDKMASEDYDAMDKVFEKMCDASEKIDPGGKSLVGAIMSFPRADGYAHYEVVKDSPFTVAHIPVGDAWHIDGITIRGLRRSDVAERLKSDREWDKLYGKVPPFKSLSAIGGRK